MPVGRPRGLDIEVSEKCGWKTKSSKMVNKIPDKRVILHTMIPVMFDLIFFFTLGDPNPGALTCGTGPAVMASRRQMLSAYTRS